MNKQINATSGMYTAILFSISFLISLLWTLIPEIFKNNLYGNFKNMALLIILVGFVIIWTIVILTSFRGNLARETLVLFLFSLFMILAIKFQGNIPALLAFNIMILIVFVCSSIWILKENWETSNMRILFTIIIMLFLLFAGLLTIAQIYGDQPALAYLNINGDVHNRYSQNGNISCFSFRGNLILVGMDVNCTVNPLLKNITSARIDFTDPLGKKSSINLSKDLSFKMPKDVYQIYIEINGTPKDGEEIMVSTFWEQRFYPLDEYEKRREKFGEALLWLFGLILITIPLVINQFRELMRDK